MNGAFAHWNKNANVAADFDRWLLNLFPGPSNEAFRFNPGGYATLNFIPSIATMIFGVLAGELLLMKSGRINKARSALVRRPGLLAARAIARRDGLPDRQANLDSVLGDRLNRLDLLAAGRFLLGDRGPRLQELVPALRRRGRQPDRDLPDVSAREAVRASPGYERPYGRSSLRRPVWTARQRALHSRRALAHLLLLYKQKIFLKI